MSERTDDSAVLARLFAVIDARRGADPETSYSAALFAKGTEKIAEKLGEEAVETIVAALSGDRDRLA
ncbi:MAG: phosphoribosyl-ATP diphosphatase, partial [Alphaproteobacteria bacterium]